MATRLRKKRILNVGHVARLITRATKKGKRAIGAKRAEMRVRGKKFNKRHKRQNTSNLVLFRI